MDNKISRRDFIKTSALTGGTLLVSTAIPGRAMNLLQEQKNENKFTNDELLKDVCDIHLHCRPDSRERSVDEFGFMKDAMAAGYRAVMFKSNDFSCHDRAYIIRQALPGAECFGSFCMNRVHGDRVNVFAAQKAVETSGGLCRCIWMPTLDAAYQYQSEGRKEKGIPVLDDNGQVLPEVVKVMEICAEADIIFATGHSSPDESITLVRKAHEVGVKRIVVTHANSSIWTMTPDQIKRCINLGAYIEYCYLPCLWGEGTKMPQYQRQSIEEFASMVRIDPTRSFISTDLGQAVMPLTITEFTLHFSWFITKKVYTPFCFLRINFTCMISVPEKLHSCWSRYRNRPFPFVCLRSLFPRNKYIAFAQLCKACHKKRHGGLPYGWRREAFKEPYPHILRISAGVSIPLLLWGLSLL